MMDLFDLCKLYRYTLVIDLAPHLRPDALGATDLPGSGKVQLCSNHIIAVTPDSQCLAYLISHELAHGLVGFCDEKDVLFEQTSILACWLEALLRDIEVNAKERLGG
jgi:hypothetical protein